MTARHAIFLLEIRMHVVNTLAPIIVTLFLGSVLRNTGFVNERFCREINRLVYWIALPCLLFSKTSQSTVELGAAWPIFLTLTLVMLVCIALAYIVGWITWVPPFSMGAFVQGAFRSNMVYVGLPVILYSLAQVSPTRSLEIESLAVLAIAPLIPVYNLTAVIVLLIGRKGGESPRAQIRKLVVNVFTNPLLLACAAGIAYLLTGWELPVAMGRSCSLVGQMALPMALVTTGASLTFKSLKGGLQETITGSLIKVVVAPLVGYWIGSGLGLARPDLQIALIFCACPSAVVGFVMAEQLGADYRLTGNMILLTTFLSMPGLALVLMLGAA